VTSPLLLANLAATLLMTGVIWVVQVVVYPQLRDVGAQVADAPALFREHGRRIVPVVTAPMLLEPGDGGGAAGAGVAAGGAVGHGGVGRSGAGRGALGGDDVRVGPLPRGALGALECHGRGAPGAHQLVAHMAVDGAGGAAAGGRLAVSRAWRPLLSAICPRRNLRRGQIDGRG